MELERTLKMGMVGGGRDAFIGAVHRSAALMDGKVEFIAGALSSDPEKAKASAQDLLISEDRSYATWQEMVEKESKLSEGERIDFVSIVTPNVMHFPIAKAFAEAGINIVCDKPMTYTLAQAKELVNIVDNSGIIFGLSRD